MTLAGLIVTMLGFFLALGSLTLTASVNGRMVVVLIGMVLCLAGIGIINKAYMKTAVWRK